MTGYDILLADYYLPHDSIGNHSQSMYKHFLLLQIVLDGGYNGVVG